MVLPFPSTAFRRLVPCPASPSPLQLPPARASPSLPFPSPTFRRLVPRPYSPPPLLLASGSGLAQLFLPFVTSVVPQHTRTSCLALRPSLDLPWSSCNPLQLATGPTPLPHTAEAHTQTHPNKCKQAS
ncbi:hypothetical protein ElyMa_006759200 [Elysia marginata]|uniref:Uncharacterized protein n=1 Tax=Elysia marginata TaxID=1093978 RepID=A0AAV4J0C6_9GAST|nr:hypothetical protein ElyMa_006759200 [Elysia marginata]